MTNILRNTLILLFSLTLVSIDAFAATAKVEISKIYTHDYRYNPIKYVNNYDGSIVDVPADVQGVYACAKLTLTDDSFPSPGYYKIPTGIIPAYIESIYSGYGMVYLAPRGYFGETLRAETDYNDGNFSRNGGAYPHKIANINEPIELCTSTSYGYYGTNRYTNKIQTITFNFYDELFHGASPPYLWDSSTNYYDPNNKLGTVSVKFKIVQCWDNDNDGYMAGTYMCQSIPLDCNDNDPNISPGVVEVPGDGIDNNCNGQIDEDACPKINRFDIVNIIVDASGRISVIMATDVSNAGDSVTVSVRGRKANNNIISGKIGDAIFKEGINYVDLIVSKDGCPSTKKSISFNVTWSNVDCKYMASFGSKSNLASGELTETIDLFSISSTDLPLELKLHYLSQDGNDGPLGVNWTHNYNTSLTEDDFGTVAVRDGSGQWALYTHDGAGYLSQPGDYFVLTKNSAGTFLLTRKDGTRYEFGANNKIAAITDRNGNALTFVYTGNDLVSVTDNAGRAVTFGYANGKLTSITDPAGNVYQLSVGTSLDSITLPDSSAWQFSYQDNAFLTAKTDPAGNLTTYRYDEQLRVIGSTDPEGRSRSIAYPTGDDPVRTTAFTDKDGSIWRYTYDVESGDLVSKTDPAGNTTSYSYDADHNLTAKTEPGVGTSYYRYDAAGNLVESTDAAGNTTAYTYNAYGQVTNVTDAADTTTSYEYDNNGNLTKVTAPDDSSTIYQYDDQGRLTSIATATGESTTLTYDARGNVETVTGPDGKPTRFTYDANGRRTSTTDADGNVTRFEYDAKGQLITVTDANENVTRYEYDTNGNRTKATDANGRATTFAYNFAGQMVSMTDALGYTTTFAYGGSAGCSSCGGGVDKLTSLTDAKGQTTLFKYDPLGRLIKETDPLGHLTEYGYDAAGLVASKTAPNGHAIHYSYDTLGRLTGKSYPDGTQTTFSYDAKGNLLTAANADIAYSFAYDSSDRLTTVADNFGHQLDYAYDAAGKRAQMTSSGIEIDYAYDTAGRLKRIDSSAGEFTFGYDILGRRSQLTFPNGVATTYTYDDLGRLTDLVSAKGSSLIAENHYTHDKVGNRLSNRDVRSTMSYGYDAIYRLTEAVSNAPGSSANTTGKGKGTANATQNQKEVYVYDPVGNRLKTDKVRSTTHNAGNELLSADGTRYSYDANGNRTSKTTVAGITTYDWDVENRLTQVTLPDGKTVAFAYDPFGRRIAKTADGMTTRYTYDGEDILFEAVNGSTGNVYIHGPGIDEPLALLDSKGPAYYHADGLGSIVVLTDADTKIVQRYEYDSFGNRKDMQNSIKQPYTYTAREYDRETGLYYYRARYYDAEVGGFISEDPIGFAGGDVNLFRYVQGNPVNYIDPSGLREWSLATQQFSASYNMLNLSGGLYTFTSNCEDGYMLVRKYLVVGGGLTFGTKVSASSSESSSGSITNVYQNVPDPKVGLTVSGPSAGFGPGMTLGSVTAGFGSNPDRAYTDYKSFSSGGGFLAQGDYYGASLFDFLVQDYTLLSEEKICCK